MNTTRQENQTTTRRYIAVKGQGSSGAFAAADRADAFRRYPDADDVVDITDDQPRAALGAWQGYDSLEDAR